MESKQSLKEIWISAIRNCNPGQPYISIKELAHILDVSINKVSTAIDSGQLRNVVKLGPESSRAEVRIPKWAAVEYINSFPENT